MDPSKFPPWLRLAVPVVALLLIIYEAVGHHGEPRYWLLVVYTAMLGIPSLLVSDARGKAQPPVDPPAKPRPPVEPYTPPVEPPYSPPPPDPAPQPEVES